MTRDQYIDLRKSNNIVPVAYNYMNENSDLRLPLDVFSVLFSKFVVVEKIGINWNLLWRHYDIKFNALILEDSKTRTIINVY